MFKNQTFSLASDKFAENLQEDSNFRTLTEMVKDEKVDIKLILSYQRSGSTMLETSFSQNSVISAYVHEPFHRYNNTADAKTGYKLIFDKVQLAKKFSIQRRSIVVKEIGSDLSFDNEYQRLISLVDSPPLFLIRNPLLSTESKIRAVLKSLNLRSSSTLQKILIKYYLHARESLLRLSIPINLVPVFENFNNYVINNYQNTERGKLLKQKKSFLKLQNWLLDYFAKSKNFKNWRVMLNETFSIQDYKPFENILLEKEIYKIDKPFMLEQIKYLQSIRKPFIIVDDTDYRLDPFTIITAVCEKWNIPFSRKMIKWGDKGIKVTIERKDLRAWFERIQKSKQVELPYEISPVLEDFPKFIAHDLKQIKLPEYFKLFNYFGRLQPQKKSWKKQIMVQLTKNTHRRFQEMAVNLSPKEAIRNPSRAIKLRIFELDPIYAVLAFTDPLRDRIFQVANKRYLLTLNLVVKLFRSTSNNI